MVPYKDWSLESDQEVLDALGTVMNYTHSAQEQIYLEARKRQLLSDDQPRFSIDQIRARIEGSRDELHVATVDVSKVARLRAMTLLCPRFLFLLGVYMGLVGIFSILADPPFGTHDDAIFDAILGVVTLVLARQISKRRRRAVIIALCLLLPLTPLWTLMVVDVQIRLILVHTGQSPEPKDHRMADDNSHPHTWLEFYPRSSKKPEEQGRREAWARQRLPCLPEGLPPGSLQDIPAPGFVKPQPRVKRQHTNLPTIPVVRDVRGLRAA